MSEGLSFRALMARLQTGDQRVAEEVHRRFVRRLVGLAASRLSDLLRAKTEPEDVVQSAFGSFFRLQRTGKLDPNSWDELWNVLAVITLRKCCDRAAYFQAARRDVRREVADESGEAPGPGWQALDREPTPDEVAEAAELAERLLEVFDEQDRIVLALRLEGYPVSEVSAMVGCSERQVYRVLERARKVLRWMSGDAEECAEAGRGTGHAAGSERGA
jgi:RNA polymerase sigma-70 factor (ECF subfamily)